MTSLSSIVERRTRLVIIPLLVAVIVCGAFAATCALTREERVEFSVYDPVLLADTPGPNQTELHVFLVIKNMRRSPITFDLVVLHAWDPIHGTLFDTYSHPDVTVEGRATSSFSHVSTLSGHWSDVSFKVKVFAGRTWESRLVPGESVEFPLG